MLAYVLIHCITSSLHHASRLLAMVAIGAGLCQRFPAFKTYARTGRQVAATPPWSRRFK